MTIDNLFQLRAWTPPYQPDPIIDKGILLPQTTLMIFGAAGTWKTMNSIHLAFCLAQGLDWFGFKTALSTVFMHQVELPKHIIRDRIIKYSNGSHQSTYNVFFHTPDEPHHIDTTFGLQQLEQEIIEVKHRAANPKLPLVCIFDPLYLYMSGHISDEYEVKKFQQNINTLRKKHNITVIIIHHSRLTRIDSSGQVVDLGAEELMGSSYWNNWLDTIIRCKLTNPFTGSDIVNFSFSKTRNAQSFLPSFTVKWYRDSLTPELLARDVVAEDAPSVRGLIE